MSDVIPPRDANVPAWQARVARALNTLLQKGSATIANLTFNSSGGGAAGTTFNGTAAKTVDYSTVGAAKTGAVTGSGLTQATARILGRTTASTGAIEEITIGSGLSLAAGSLSASGGGTVSTTGSPASGNLTKFSGASSITNGDLSGDVTTSGTLATTLANDAVTNAKLANMAASTIKARKTASTGDPEDCTLSEVLDLVGSAAQGDILYRGSSTWTRLGAGTAGQVLTTQGASANPTWTAKDANASATAPSVRSIALTTPNSASSFVVSFPSGAAAGDLCVIGCGNAFAINCPSGWFYLDRQDGTNWNGAVICKSLSSGDVTTGSVTITTTGSFNSTFAAWLITTGTWTQIVGPTITMRASSGGTTAALCSQIPCATDRVLFFSSCRGTLTCTMSSGITNTSASAGANSSGIMGQNSAAPADLYGVSELATYSAATTNGLYTAVITVQ